MRRLIQGLAFVLGLTCLAITFSAWILTVTEPSLTTISWVSLVLLMLFGGVFLITAWFSMWNYGPRRTHSRTMHENKMLRHQVRQLHQDAQTHRQTITALQKEVDYLRTQLYTPLTQTGMQRTVRQTGRFAAAKTGTHPIFRTGEMRRTNMPTESDTR